MGCASQGSGDVGNATCSGRQRGSNDGHGDEPTTYMKLEVSFKNASRGGHRCGRDDGHGDELTTIMKVEVSFSEP
jgi:hypothetical protein